MQSQNRFFDDFAKMATSAAGTLQSARQEFETMMRQQMERLVAKMDLVPREEFDAVKEMAAEARLENERLKARIEALEKGVKPSASSPRAAKAGTKSAKSAAKKSTGTSTSETA